MLGKVPDRAIADEFGCSDTTVKRARQRLGVKLDRERRGGGPPPSVRKRTAERIKQVQQMRAQEPPMRWAAIARVLGITRQAAHNLGKKIDG